MNKTITVRGVGTVSVKPDNIVISFNISEKSREYSDAVEGANKRIALLQGALTSVGFVKEDLKTLSFNVRTDYENYRDESGEYRTRFAGYICDYQLKLSFDMDSKRLAQTLDSISSSKADTNLSVSFTVKDPERISAELLKSAAENARQKAEILCAASGVKLGGLVNIDYDWNEVRFVSKSDYAVAALAAPRAAVPEFEPEDIKSKDSATFIWEIM